MSKNLQKNKKKEIYNTFFQLGKKHAIELMYKYGSKTKNNYVKINYKEY
ncbi:hypothetical protein [Mycoplasmopsis gallopavonis]|nr:hypothetical protein [Mycoplasmopsis gallopavonis]